MYDNLHWVVLSSYAILLWTWYTDILLSPKAEIASNPTIVHDRNKINSSEKYALIIAPFTKHKSNKNGQTFNIIRVHMVYQVG